MIYFYEFWRLLWILALHENVELLFSVPVLQLLPLWLSSKWSSARFTVCNECRSGIDLTLFLLLIRLHTGYTKCKRERMILSIFTRCIVYFSFQREREGERVIPFEIVINTFIQYEAMLTRHIDITKGMPIYIHTHTQTNRNSLKYWFRITWPMWQKCEWWET